MCLTLYVMELNIRADVEERVIVIDRYSVSWCACVMVYVCVTVYVCVYTYGIVVNAR